MNPADYFTCLKYRCTMRKNVCVARQKKANAKGARNFMYGLGPTEYSSSRYGGCKNCEQGRAIAAGPKEVSMEGEKFTEPIKKKCSICKELKALDEFPNNKRMLDGHEGRCKTCKKEIQKRYWEKRKARAKKVTAVPPVAPPAARPQRPPTGNGDMVLPYVITDLAQRAKFGARKYGTLLKTQNGRNALWDAYQEALDLCMYLRQALLEREEQPKSS